MQKLEAAETSHHRGVFHPPPHKSHRNEKTQAPWTHWNSTVAANSSPTRRVLFMTR